MTKDKIISLPNKHLRQTSASVEKVTAEIKKIVSDMESATISWDKSRAHEIGVALAAVQIDKLYRIVIVKQDYDNKEDHSFTYLINPEIIKLDGDLVEDFEGCLSVPNIYGKVPRYSKVKIKALDINGNEIKLLAKGFLARILQHEIDHTKGALFIDKIKDNPDAFFILNEEGKLIKLDYEKDVKKNSILWK
jgi:peptide deformylase